MSLSRVLLIEDDPAIGIPEDDPPHLFERFHRGRNTGGYPGSGLGLAIVRAVIGAHNGSVEAQNLETGSRFIVSLPLIRYKKSGPNKSA